MSRFSETSNPALNKDKLENLIYGERDASAGLMTIGGVVNKTLLYLAVICVAAGFTFYMAVSGSPLTMPLTFGGMIAAFILAMVVMSKPKLSSSLGFVYAVCEGLFLGGISAYFAAKTDGIVIQAVGLTMATLFTMLAVYRFKIIRVTEKFKSIMVTLIGAVMVYYMASFVLGLLGFPFLSPLHHGGVIGIGICAVILVIAALTLLLDFDFIEKCVESNAPKYMEWYAAFSLVLTLVWLYFEFLRLLSIISGD